jgi:hypothetical protein
VLGVWLVETYRTQFAQEINTKGVDGLIASLVQRNKSNNGKPAEVLTDAIMLTLPPSSPMTRPPPACACCSRG